MFCCRHNHPLLSVLESVCKTRHIIITKSKGPGFAYYLAPDTVPATRPKRWGRGQTSMPKKITLAKDDVLPFNAIVCKEVAKPPPPHPLSEALG